MVMCIEDFVSSSGADAAGDMPQSSCRDSATWKSLYDRERIRAEAAEGRCEELRLQEVEGPREFPEGDFREQPREAGSCPCGGQGNSADGEAVSCAEAGGCASGPASCRGRRAEAVDGGVAAHGECRPEDRDEGSEGSGRRTTSFVRTGRTGARARRGRGRHRSAASSTALLAAAGARGGGGRLEVAEDACLCCVANGSHQDHRDQKRRIVRRGCDCPGSPVAAVSRHRLRVWTHVLHERVHARRVQGLSPGTLASEPDAAPVRAASGRDPRAPGFAPCRCIQAPREVRKSRLAPDIGQP